MTVYVDKLHTYGDHWYKNAQATRVGRRHGHQWCHLEADSPEELHAFARRLGLRPEWAHRRHDGSVHYDLVPTKRALALRLGAVEEERLRKVTP